MSKEIKLNVSEGLSNYLHLLSLNVGSRLNFLNNLPVEKKLNDPIIKEYMNEYYIYDAEYRIIVDKLSTCVSSCTKTESIINWDLDFDNAVLTLKSDSDIEIDTNKLKLAIGNIAMNKKIVSEIADIYDNDNFNDETGLFDNDKWCTNNTEKQCCDEKECSCKKENTAVDIVPITESNK